jgi:hypothetical protein
MVSFSFRGSTKLASLFRVDLRLTDLPSVNVPAIERPKVDKPFSLSAKEEEPKKTSATVPNSRSKGRDVGVSVILSSKSRRGLLLLSFQFSARLRRHLRQHAMADSKHRQSQPVSHSALVVDGAKMILNHLYGRV